MSDRRSWCFPPEGGSELGNEYPVLMCRVGNSVGNSEKKDDRGYRGERDSFTGMSAGGDFWFLPQCCTKDELNVHH